MPGWGQERGKTIGAQTGWPVLIALGSCQALLWDPGAGASVSVKHG